MFGESIGNNVVNDALMLWAHENLACWILCKPTLLCGVIDNGYIPKKCLLGLCLECETFIRGVFCPNLFVCLYVCMCVCPLFLKKINNG